MNNTNKALATMDTEVVSVTPMDMIVRAAQNGASIEQMQQLFELKLRVEADEAKKAFKKAFSSFKAEGIRIVKNITIKDGPLKGKKHADLFGVCVAVIPALSKFGLSHAWKLTKDEPAWMEVACTISHEDGYSESVPMGGAPDTGPGRNAIQARGSTMSYLERYTLMAALGLAAEEQDADGNVASGPTMPEKEVVSRLDAIDAARDESELKKFFNAAYAEADKIGDKNAIKAFVTARDKKRKEFA